MIIGVVGQIACGKGELKDYLVRKLGFTSFSLSSIVHNELKSRLARRGLARLITRKDLQDMGDELRKKYGDAVLAKKAIKLLSVIGGTGGRAPDDAQQSEHRREGNPGQNLSRIVIEGIRNPGEIEYLKKIPHFILVGVKAKRELRFKRLLKRDKAWDPKTWNKFLIVDRRDLGMGQKKSGQQVGKCLAYCDYVLTNNKDVKDFQRKVKSLMEKLF